MNPKVILLAMSIATASGCSNENDSIPPLAQANTEASILGLWSLVPLDNELVDSGSAFFEITGDQINYFLYNGDNEVASANCYTRDSQALNRLSGDNYLIGNGDVENTITATPEELTITFIDALDDDSDGDVNETIVERFPRITNIDVIDLNICS